LLTLHVVVYYISFFLMKRDKCFYLAFGQFFWFLCGEKDIQGLSGYIV